MKILIVNAVELVGGAERWIAHLVRRLGPRGHSFGVAHHPSSPLGELAREAGADVWTPATSFRGTARTALQLAREIRREGYDLVVSTSGPDLKPAGFAARLAGHPGAVARLNSIWQPDQPVIRAGAKWRRRRWYHRHLVQLAATNSRAGAADIVGRDHLPPERVVPIYNGVDLARFDPGRTRRGHLRHELGIPPGAPLVVSVSRYAARKGQEFELEAAGRLAAARPELHVVFAGPCHPGDEPYKTALRAQAAGFPGGDRIHFLGTRSDVPQLLADADLLVRAALKEGLPNCALEAMAMRLPVVATAICGTPEAVLDGETGRLVPPGDADAIVAAVADLLDAPPERRAEIGRRGRAHVEAQFTLDRMADEYEQLFRRALTERVRRG